MHRSVLLSLVLAGCPGDSDTGTEPTPNQAPSAPSVVLTPVTPTAAVDLTAALETGSVDPYGDEVTYAYRWTVDGASHSSTAEAIHASNLMRDQEWAVTVTATDGELESAPATATATIHNSPPVVGSISVSSTAPLTNDTLTATARASDIDRDPTTITLSWKVNGADTGVSGEALDGALHFDKGDVVTVAATADDGTDTSAPLISAEATVANTPPDVPTVEVVPPVFEAGTPTALQCVTAATDADAADTLTVSIAWLGDGAAYPDDFGAATGPSTTDLDRDTIPAADSSLADEWTCIADVSDGTDVSGPAQAVARALE